MNFTQAMKVLLGGGKVSSNGVVYIMSEDGYGLQNEANAEFVPITAAMLDATNFVNAGPAIPALEPDEIYAVFNEEKARYVSTTEPARHKAAGKRVAVFVLDQLI